MNVTDPRFCPHCGSNIYFAQNFERVRDKAAAVEAEIRRMAAAQGVERANWELERINRANEHSWAQAKAHKQRLVIKKLEAKLRKLGQIPHEEG